MTDHTISKVSATVFVVDDDTSSRILLATLLEQVQRSAKVFASAGEFLEFYHPDMPGCLVADIMMPDIDGLQLQEILNTRNISIPTIFMSAYGNIAIAKQALKHGAVDFVEKPINLLELTHSIETALALDKSLRQRRQQNSRLEQHLSSLTHREQEVMDWLLEGKSNKEVEEILSISLRTVETHRANILKKFNCNSFSELVLEILGSKS